MCIGHQRSSLNKLIVKKHSGPNSFTGSLRVIGNGELPEGQHTFKGLFSRTKTDSFYSIFEHGLERGVKSSY